MELITIFTMHHITATFKQIGLLTTALTLALVANFAYGQWADPTAEAPGNNATAPINIGGERQNKLGDIGAFTISASDDVRSDEYCNYAGDVCFSATATAAMVNSGGSGGGSSTGIWDYVSVQAHPGNGNRSTYSTGFSGTPINVQVDLVNLSSEGGYNRGDVIHNITSTAGHSDRWHDFGLVIYSEANGNINLKVSQKGLNVIRKNAPTAAGTAQQINVNPSNWAFVVKAKDGGDAYASLNLPAPAPAPAPAAPRCPPGTSFGGGESGTGVCNPNSEEGPGSGTGPDRG